MFRATPEAVAVTRKSPAMPCVRCGKPSTVQGFRKVEVTAESKGLGKLTVRTRTGYFPVVRTAKQTASVEK